MTMKLHSDYMTLQPYRCNHTELRWNDKNDTTLSTLNIFMVTAFEVYCSLCGVTSVRCSVKTCCNYIGTSLKGGKQFWICLENVIIGTPRHSPNTALLENYLSILRVPTSCICITIRSNFPKYSPRSSPDKWCRYSPRCS